MSTRTYVNFDLLVEKEEDGTWTARVTGAPVGAGASTRFRLPFDATGLENLLLKLDPGRSGTRRSGASTQQQAAMDFGGPLYEAMFDDGVLLAWSRSQDRVREQGGGLRLRLRLTEAAEIAGLPWELLYDRPGNTFIAQSERTPLVRYLDVPSVPRTIAVDGPLRVLAVIASPTDLDTLDVEGEWARLQEAMADRIAAGSVVLDRLPRPVVSALGPWLRRHETHVIHFVGHGDFDERLREGVVYFEDEHGARATVTSSVLGPFVRDHDPLRMVVLNACRSARTDALDPFGGIAQGLVQQETTAVVAMQFPISDRAAVAFTSDFYGAVVDGLPVDQAITSARKALLGGFRDEWATPVLFLRSADGVIFTDVRAAPEVLPLAGVASEVDAPEDDEADDARPVLGSDEQAEPVLHRDDDPVPPDGTRRRWVMIGATAGVMAVAIGLVVFLLLRDRSIVDLPVASQRLPDDVILVAAGDDLQHLDVFRVDVDTGDRDRVTDGGGRTAGPSIAEDRKTLLVTVRDPDTGDYELKGVDPSGTDAELVPFERKPEECSDSMERAARSPTESSVIVVTCSGEGGGRHLVKLDLETGSSQVLDSRTALGDPTISRDGEWAVYWVSTVEDARRGGELYKVALDDPSPEPVTLDLGSGIDDDPVLSPVDDTLVFRRTTGKTSDLWKARLDSTGPATALYGDPSVDEADPVFSPDGQRLAFKTGAGDSSRIWTLDLADPEATAIELPGGRIGEVEIAPSWSRH